MRSLGLFAQGGHQIGLGHVMRAASLAREAQRLGLEPTLWVEGDEATRQVARSEAGRTQVRDAALLPAVHTTSEAWILDGPGKLDPVLEATQAADCTTVVLDRVDLVERATWTVLPVLHAAPPPDRRIRHGADWCILEPWLRGCRAPDHPGARDGLLVVFGGSDPEGLLLRVAEAWRQAPPGLPRPRFVVGPAAPAGRVRALARLGFAPDGEDGSVLVAPSRDELYAAMATARLAVCSFGLCLYELAALGTPALCVTRSEGDAMAARRLAELGIGRPIGGAQGFDAHGLPELVRGALDEGWPGSSSAAGARALGDGQGPRRILELAIGRAAS